MYNNIHEVEFGPSTLTQIEQLYQYDKGQILKIADPIEDGTEVQFSNGNSDTTINKAINDSQVEIPDILLQENKKILAYLKIINSDSETTIKTVIIPVKARTKPADYIEPEQEKPFRKYVEEKLENAEKLVAEANDKVKVNEECLKQIDTRTEQATTQITEVTNAKLTDLADTTNQQLENINTTAVSQIKAINSSAAAAGESQTKGINTVASSQISNITNVTNQQLNNINATVTHQIGIIEDKTSTQIESINNTATSQISAINSTALSQIKSINNVAQEMNLHYSEMCRNLGIDHNGIVFAETTRERPSTMYSIDVSNFKYIKFAKVVIGDFIEVTLPAEGICSIWITNLEAVETNVISDKEYDVSLISELKYYVAYPGSGHKTIVNYSLYNDEDGINGVTDLIVENALGGDY
ncbi:hypothetical protein [Eubacterium sp. LMAG:50]|uniref:hypothetical protein n=1 Tax=Eubacterium sp. LMAG:50 TaxID=1969563 RepID=UPI0025C217F7|nr:hypothetical protein [Eubacterium sp. LMAG:50]